LPETSDPEERRVAPSDLDCGRLGGQPVTDHGAPQSFEQATLFPRKDRLQLATLLGICTVADVQTSRSLAAKEIAWPLRCESDFGSVEIDALGIAALNVETKCATGSGDPSGPSQHGHNILQLQSSTLRPESCQPIAVASFC